MSLPILAVDKNVEVHIEQAKAASGRSIQSVRVSSMSEGIEKLTKSKFLFVAINADNIDYLPQLQIMCDVAVNAPVLIVIKPSNYNVVKHTEALNNGAFAFGPWADTPDKNLDAAIALSQRYNKCAKLPTKIPNPLFHKNIMIVNEQRLVIINDRKITLTPKEYKLLYYFMNNIGRVLSYRNIIRYVWGSEYIENSNRALFTKMKDLRKKLIESGDDCEYIDNVRGVGYKLTT